MRYLTLIFTFLFAILFAPVASAQEAPPELAQQVATLIENQSTQDYLTEVNPNLRYVFETSQEMLPTMEGTQVVAGDIATLVFGQVQLLGLAGLIWHLLWIVVPITGGLIVNKIFTKWANHPTTNSSDSGFYQFIGVCAVIIGFLISGISGFHMFEPLAQTIAPGAWLVTEVIK